MLIGLTGKKRSGKDTVGDYLVENYGFKKLSFAGPLKEACSYIFDLDEKQINGTTEQKEMIDERWGLSPRQLLQFVGTELFRKNWHMIDKETSEDIWIKILDIKNKINVDDKIVITDVRFQNEIDYIKRKGGIVIKILRPTYIVEDNHSSENIDDLQGQDIDLYNIGDIKDIHLIIDGLVEEGFF